ncbi:hypothetical protein CLOBY_40650 [Clostridium saccharobutylicum]|uniref:hypothetical protein n=1 Tax=Clostridium saccharobutylicum TaxID=169679 RepID=UPI000983C50E|nr:hypothetical protein [Clostridium saccharobutylicum]AQS11907.1 hypothetical protein CLOBY_40650 [Clostridium saccharobutylicum]MBC2435605.1 hypothetical protein [Clostridium saccharobutylicum]NSB87013.1 hypothetical protein [Clostridium saccharobutylicum]NYC30082.1 hypothetical protein [Clostridium saccharobutylicum]OOM18751.1 hypothetical protein CLSAB_05200 [Clostridium saccharobutylicum]
MINAKQIKSVNKYYNIAKILFTITPFLYMIYLSMGTTKFGESIPQLIQENPKITVMFLISMINLFIAYLLIFMHKKIEDGDIAYAVVNLAVLIISEIMLQNIFYISLLGFLIIKTLKTYNVSFKECFIEKLDRKFLGTISGGIVVLILSGICLFATIRISM